MASHRRKDLRGSKVLHAVTRLGSIQSLRAFSVSFHTTVCGVGGMSGVGVLWVCGRCGECVVGKVSVW